MPPQTTQAPSDRTPSEPDSSDRTPSDQSSSDLPGSGKAPANQPPLEHPPSEPASSGQDWSGQDSSGQDSSGRDSSGQDSSGQTSGDRDSCDRDSCDRGLPDQAPSDQAPSGAASGSDRTAPDRTPPDYTTPDCTAPDCTAPDYTAPDYTGPDRPRPADPAAAADPAGSPGKGAPASPAAVADPGAPARCATPAPPACPASPASPAVPAEPATPSEAARRLAMLHRIEVLLAALLALFALWSVYVAKTVVLPVLLGFLIWLTLMPVVRWLARRGVPHALSAVAIILTIGAGSAYGFYLMRLPAQTLIEQAPQIQQELRVKLWRVMHNVEQLREASEKMSQMATGTNAGAAEDQTVVVTPATSFLQTALSGLATSGTVLAVALLFAMFLLSMGDAFRARLVQSFPDFRRKRRAARISKDVERQISRYLAAITMINAGLGVAVGLTLHLLGMPYAMLWGVAAFLLNYLPYMGAIIGVGAAAAVALVTISSTGQALMVPLAYLVLTSIEGQMITPWLVGRHLQLNTAAVFIAVVFWAWLWGAAGAVLAVPLLVFVKVLCDNVPGLTTLGRFLEARRPRETVREGPPGGGRGRAARRVPFGIEAGVGPRVGAGVARGLRPVRGPARDPAKDPVPRAAR